MENTNLYKLVNACIDHGPGWAHPGSRKLRPQAFKLDMKDIMGYDTIKKNETRTYAQLNASRPRTVANEEKKTQESLGTGGHRPGSSLQFTSFRTNPRRLQAHKPRVQASSPRSQAPGLWSQGTSAQA
jgi:hypothetical protein